MVLHIITISFRNTKCTDQNNEPKCTDFELDNLCGKQKSTLTPKAYDHERANDISSKIVAFTRI